MSRLPIKIKKLTINPGEHAISINLGNEARLFLYCRDDPTSARIAKVLTTEDATELAKEIARVLREKWDSDAAKRT